MKVTNRLSFVVMAALVCTLAGLAFLSSCVPLVPPGAGGGPAFRDDGASLFQDAEEYYRRQSYRQAYQRYEAYVQRYPQGPDAVRARLREAECLGLMGDWEGSLRRYQGLLARGVEPEAAQKARYGSGRAAFRLGRYQYAGQVLESLAAETLPVSTRFGVNAMLAEIALKQSQVSQAFARLRLAGQDLSSGDQEWFDDLKTRLVKQATPQELEQLADLYRDTPLSAALLARLARLAQEAGRPDEAQRWLNILRERYPDSQEGLGPAGRPGAGGRREVVCLLPLSGDFAEAGRKVRQGLELAAADTQLGLVFKDCPADPEAAARLVREVGQTSRHLAIIGPLTSGNATAATKAAQEAGIPIICLAQKGSLTSAGNLVFQVALTARAQARQLVGYAMSTRGLKRFAVFAPDSAYGRTLAQAFTEEVQAQGGIVAARETFASGTQDFTLDLGGLLAEYKPGAEGQATFEAIFIPDDAATVAAIAEQAAESALKQVLLLGTNLVLPGAAQSEERKHLEGIIFTDAFYRGDSQPAAQKFTNAFQQRFGTMPDFLAVQGYVAVKALSRALETNPGAGRTELAQSLAALRDPLVLPWLRGFTADRQADLALYVLTLRGGRVQAAGAAAPSGRMRPPGM